MKFCRCGCGKEITSPWQKYQEINYIKGHGRGGKKNSLEHTNDPKIAKAIAFAHLCGESPVYYSKGLIPLERRLKGK